MPIEQTIFVRQCVRARARLRLSDVSCIVCILSVSAVVPEPKQIAPTRHSNSRHGFGADVFSENAIEDSGKIHWKIDRFFQSKDSNGLVQRKKMQTFCMHCAALLKRCG